MIFDRKIQTCIFDTNKVQGGGGRRLSSERDGTTLSALSTAASVADKEVETTACMPSSELEHKLEEIGVGIGARALELGCLREKSSKRETRMLGILQFITSVVWKMLFGNASKDAVSLEKSVEQEDEFMIVEKQPIVTTYISSAPCSCAAFVAGIVRGVLEGAQFPARVTAHDEDTRTVILIKFAPEVLEREHRLS